MAGVHYETTGNVAVLVIDNPPVNSLAVTIRQALGAALDQAYTDDSIGAVVLIGAGNTFVAGAEIREFGTPKATVEPLLTQMQKRIENGPKPVIAAIHGNALGGGFELALACHARIATPDARFGLPEGNLGLLTGAGGSQRLPRLIGPQAALDMIVSCKPMDARKAFDLGVIDALANDLKAEAIAFAQDAVDKGTHFVPVMQRGERLADVPDGFFDDYRKKLKARVRGKLVPFVAVDCVEAACTLPGDEGLAYEKMRSLEVKQTDQHRALKAYFFAEREARKIPDMPADVRPKDISAVGIIGAGTMGGGIAMACATAGVPVILVDQDQTALDKGMQKIRTNYDISAKRGSLSDDAVKAALGRITTTTDYADLQGVDLVIEAAFEKMEVKTAIFEKLDAVLPANVILSSNTSSLDIDQMADATGRPDRVIGAHFFAPANVMKLLEIVRGKRTSFETIATVMAFGKRIGKVTALTRNCDGFIGNRMLQYYSGQAEFLLEQGATPEQVDRVATAFGMAMGPLAVRDMTGIDVNVLVRRARRKTLAPGDRMSEIPDRLFEAGRLGQKSGAGYYRYEGRERFADDSVMEIIESVSRDLGITRRTFTDEEVRDRLFFPIVNEGFKELEDGTAIRAGDIDVVWVNGYGWPAYLGGPMHWGENAGLENVLAMAETLARENGPRWGPSDLLRSRVASAAENQRAAEPLNAT